MKIQILDSTLREGAQSEGISFSVEDKLHIVRCLDRLGIDVIECGFPVTVKEKEFFKRLHSLKLEHSRLSAFCATRRKGLRCEEDPIFADVLECDTPYVTLFGKCHSLHVEEVIGASLEENLKMIEQSCAYFAACGKKVIFDAEHFFDGYKYNSDYAIECIRAAKLGGAETICLCDTSGGCMPWEVSSITAAAVEKTDNVNIGIHCHNDCGLASALSLCGVKSGAKQVQGTLLGIGERCGNAPLYAVIADLQLKMGYECISDEALEHLTHISNEIAEICNISIKRGEPFVGRSAFSHKAGTHVDSVMKDPSTLEHIPPEKVGNVRRMLTSEMSGRAAIYRRTRRVAPDVSKDSPELGKILSELQRLEYMGYQFEGASAGFDLMVKRVLGSIDPSFELVSYRVLDELPYERGCSATATIKIRVGGQLRISAAEGDGPVNALDKALREALGFFYPVLSSVHLIDYKVRVLESKEATASVVRVLITSTDGKEVWSTVGVSSNIIEASFNALVDSIEYKLKVMNNLCGASEKGETARQ